MIPGRHVVLEERSSVACAVAAADGRLVLVWTGSDYRLNTVSCGTDFVFVGKETLPYRSWKTVETMDDNDGGPTTYTTREYPLPPALAATAGGLHLAWTDTDTVCLTGVCPPPLPPASTEGPGLGGRDGRLTLGWVDRHHRVNLAVADQGVWTGTVVLEETSHVGPAVCAAGTETVVAWTGTDHHINMMHTQGGTWSVPQRMLETSGDAPAMCMLGSEIVLAWTGRDRHVNLLRAAVLPGFTAGAITFGPSIRLEATSASAPAICTSGESLVLAWTGGDRRVNVALIPGT